MKMLDQKAWMEKNEKLNANIALHIGMEVKDADGHKGIVVRLEVPEGVIDIDNHGSVAVWQSERTGYGDDNCEHYTLHSWKRMLRILTPDVYQAPRPKP